MDRGVRPPKPFKVRIQPISSCGRDTEVYRVMYCLSSYRDLLVTLRSFVTIGSGDHEETQLPQLWVESDLFSPSNFCARCGDMSHSTSVCYTPESKERGPFRGCCGTSGHKVIHCSRKAKSRDIISSLAIQALVDCDYNESANFSRALQATITSEVASLPPPYKIPGRLPKDPKPGSAAEEPSRSMMEIDRSPVNAPQLADLFLQSADESSLLIQLFASPPAPFHASVLTLSGADFYEMIERHYQIDR